MGVLALKTIVIPFREALEGGGFSKPHPSWLSGKAYVALSFEDKIKPSYHVNLYTLTEEGHKKIYPQQLPAEVVEDPGVQVIQIDFSGVPGAIMDRLLYASVVIE